MSENILTVFFPTLLTYDDPESCIKSGIAYNQTPVIEKIRQDIVGSTLLDFYSSLTTVVFKFDDNLFLNIYISSDQKLCFVVSDRASNFTELTNKKLANHTLNMVCDNNKTATFQWNAHDLLQKKLNCECCYAFWNGEQFYVYWKNSNITTFDLKADYITKELYLHWRDDD